MVDRTVDVVSRLKSLEDAASPLVSFLQNPSALQDLKADKSYNLHLLHDRYQIEALYQYAKLQFECGKYSGAADYLYQYRALCTNSDRSLSALWDVAHEELNHLKDIIDSKAEFFITHEPGAESGHLSFHFSILKFLLYLNAIIQTNSPHLLRYLATAFVVNKRRRPLVKDFIRVVQQEQNSYKDPITEFLAFIYVNYDFEGTQKKMRECEEVEEGNYTAVPLRDEFLENARLFMLETYCQIHRRIEMGVLAGKLNLNYEEAERWIVNLIRTSKLEAKIDLESGTGTMKPNTPNALKHCQVPLTS
ncbi:hypothetical protein MLD38_028806 [Melastoma candidum]|uniref:Uncharacterized protein n=1 Tax=Melastoma candidum TaxID=119954 RepID=A0ACB9N1S5_9MYRT|nr:hypothetical protein MLD38_028806 [Melastoma candidum]